MVSSASAASQLLNVDCTGGGGVCGGLSTGGKACDGGSGLMLAVPSRRIETLSLTLGPVGMEASLMTPEEGLS